MAQKRQPKINFTFIDLFAGIGGMRIAFESHGGQCVFSSEWDRFSKITYERNFGEVPHGDITKIPTSAINAHDVLLAGFPCQPFSNAGLRGGFTDPRGEVFSSVLRILKDLQPKMALLENVKGFLSHDGGRTFKRAKAKIEARGYQVSSAVLNAKDFGLPQNRERVFLVCTNRQTLGEIEFEFPIPTECDTWVGMILEEKVDPKYILSDKLWKSHQRRRLNHHRRGNGFGYSLVDANSPHTRTLSARYYKDGSEILIKRRGNPRRITPREAARLQGFPKKFEIVVSDTQAYKQFGNAVPVTVVDAIAREMAKHLGANSGRRQP